MKFVAQFQENKGNRCGGGRGRAATRANTVQIKRGDVVGADGRPQGPTHHIPAALAPTNVDGLFDRLMRISVDYAV